MFEKDELNLSLKSLQEEHNKILQQNEVSVYQAQRGLVLLFIEFQKLLLYSGFPKMLSIARSLGPQTKDSLWQL